MKEVRKFAASFPGFNNPADLPSGTTQLSQMKDPVVMKLWKEKNPVTFLFCIRCSIFYYDMT